MTVNDIMHAIEDGCDCKCDGCTLEIFKSTHTRGGHLCNMLRDENIRKGIWNADDGGRVWQQIML